MLKKQDLNSIEIPDCNSEYQTLDDIESSFHSVVDISTQTEDVITDCSHLRSSVYFDAISKDELSSLSSTTLEEVETS